MKDNNFSEALKKVKLSDLGKILTGNTPSTKCEEYYNSNDVMFIKPDDLRENTLNKINTSKVYISSIGAEKARKVPAGSILVTCIGIIGKVAIVEDEACFNQQINAIIPDNNIVDSKFLGYAILKYNYLLRARANAPIVPIINKTQFSYIEINIQPLEIQKKIVRILEKSEKVIEKRKETIKLLDELVKSRFIEMFGDPVKNPKGWKIEKMNDVAPVINYKGDFNKEKIWLLNLDMVESNTGKIIDYNYVTKEEIGSSTCTFDTTNVLYSKLRPYLNKVVIPTEIGYATSEMVPLQPKIDTLNRYYLTYMLRSESFVSYISEKVAGAKMPRVSMNDFRIFDVALPPIELQNKFESFVKQVDKLKFEMEKSLKELENNFNSLMQKAFKGELFN